LVLRSVRFDSGYRPTVTRKLSVSLRFRAPLQWDADDAPPAEEAEL
jgi:hypothetical protein